MSQNFWALTFIELIYGVPVYGHHDSPLERQLLQGLGSSLPRKDLYRFECLNLKTNQTQTFKFRLGGFLEAADAAFRTMNKPHYIPLRHRPPGKSSSSDRGTIAKL